MPFRNFGMKNTQKEVLLEVGDFWPICLLNGTVKIISKIPANRISKVLSSLIGDYQNGFIAGRSILERVVLAQEIVQYCAKNKTPSMMLKLDFLKAYDMVD